MSKARELSELGDKITVDGSGNSTFDGDVSAANLSTTGNITVSGTVDGRDVAADGTKLDGIEAGADVTDTANVTAAGALMDSEVTNLAAVKAFNPADYATAAQGSLADSAVQPNDSPTFAGLTTTANVTFGDNDKAIFGAGSDLQIYHDGSHSFIKDTGTGNLFIDADAITYIRGNSGTENIARFNANGAVELFYDDAQKLATTATGVSVTGTVAATAFTGDGSALTGINTDPYDSTTTSTGFFAIPAGTTAQRPGSPAVGMVRYNTTESSYELYDGTTWKVWDSSAYPYTVEYLVVGGGGAGGTDGGGGGGAGGYLSSSAAFTPGTVYTITVGAGGAATANGTAANGNSGSDSAIVQQSITATGGGGGGGNNKNGLSGGSGGGAGQGGPTSGGSGTSGQGFRGGNQNGDNGGGGGGGATQQGEDTDTHSRAGDGGNGSNALSTWATATSTGDSGYYAGGGGGGFYNSSAQGIGGAGGGGNGPTDNNNSNIQAGQANTGGGGGGGSGTNWGGRNGGSGIVILRYAGSQRGTGGTVVSSGGYTYHTFTASGNYTA